MKAFIARSLKFFCDQMIQLQGAGKRFGHKLLFEDCDWLITPKERTGLVGGNGTGKSTLLKILCGIESLDYGSISFTKGITSGYLPQDGLVAHRAHRLRRMHERLRRPARDGAGAGDAAPQAGRARSCQRRIRSRSPTAATTSTSEFRNRDGYAIEAQVGTVLNGLGLPQGRLAAAHRGVLRRLADAASRSPSCCSKSRTCCCSTSPPITWISKRATGSNPICANYPNAFVLISHDRYFLDVTVNRTVEIWNKKVHFYSGNYEKYLAQKAERRAQLEAAYRNQRERIEQLEAFINRFRYQATKAKQVQSRIKELEKIERIEIPPTSRPSTSRFPQPKPSGRIVAEFKDVSKSYGAEARVQRRELHHRARRPHRAGRHQRRGQVDADQAAGRAPSRSPPASYTLGHNVMPDYFAQDQYKELDPDARMLDDLSQRRAALDANASCARCWDVSCSAKTTCSNRSACFPAASATATRWRACCWRRRISCCWTSPRITWTCAPRTCCSKR